MRSFSIGKSAQDRVIDAEPVAPTPSRPATQPGANANMKTSDRETIICDDIHIRGDLVSEEKLLIEGAIEGEVRGSSIEIGQNGRVTGSIIGDTITVRGRVEGMITATTVQLAKTAIVEGDILHQGIGIEMGTRYDGRLKWNGEPKTAAGTARTVEALKQTVQHNNAAQPQAQHPNQVAPNNPQAAAPRR